MVPNEAPIDTKNINEKVYELLRERIVTSTYPPGYKIKVRILSKELGTSQTPIKDALSRLAGEGLVQIDSRKGTYVKGITEQDIAEIFDTRMIIETGAAEIVAKRITDEQIKKLQFLSRQIDKIVDVINMVSIQTNMLAVNGAIEAARAGEFGKGFAVVAADIRNLAHDSTQNAAKIKDMVKSINDQISTVSKDVEEIMKQAIQETEKARTVTTMLDTIEKEAFVVGKGAQEILDLVTTIASSMEQIKVATEQIATSAQEALKAAEEAATAAKEQSKGTEELSKAIEEIASLADELQSFGFSI